MFLWMPLFENYVKTGKARVEYHYFPLQQHEPGATITGKRSR